MTIEQLTERVISGRPKPQIFITDFYCVYDAEIDYMYVYELWNEIAHVIDSNHNLLPNKIKVPYKLFI